MKQLLKRLLRRIRSMGTPETGSDPLITISISKKALLTNLYHFAVLTPHGNIAPVLKSNAYGHGLALVAHVLEDERNHPQSPASKIPFFVIDSYFEAAALRNEGIRTPLLVIGYTTPETILNNRLRDVICTITSIDTLKKISESFQIKKMAALATDPAEPPASNSKSTPACIAKEFSVKRSTKQSFF